MASPTVSRDAARRAAFPTMAQFFMNGAAFATWGVQIPVIKAAFGATDAMMSVAMLCVAGGAVLTMKHVGRWVTRLGSARALTLGGLAYAATLLAIPFIGHFALLLGLLLLFGMAMAAFDVAMNVQAAHVEEHLGRPIMSTMHGMFSVGGMTGAALGGTLLTLGASLQAHAALAAALLAGVSLSCASRLMADPPDTAQADGGQPGSSRIPAALWVLGTVAFLGLVCEGAMYDWAALYMRDVAGTSLERSGYGYAAFSTGMAACRFGADFLRRRIRESTLLTGGAWLGFAGISLALLVPTPAASLAGFAMMGLGVANFMPFFFLAGSRLPGLSPAAGVAGVAQFAYAGMLFGPPTIGAITHLYSLRGGLAVVALIMVGIALVGIRQIGKAMRRA